ncbi:MAG: DNA translocase FtsK 4TM domain-containing protein, partial [Lachnospiraceae bacterium]|nr:DNA translocase FtsK 4TM domain-containing protein [Lachnospiraceae bacterium]
MATKKRTSSKRTTKKKTISRKTTNPSQIADAFHTEIQLWVLIACSLLLFISNLGVGGVVGNTVSRILFGLFGMIAYIFPILLIIGSIFAISNRGNRFAMVKLVASILFMMCLCIFLSLLSTEDSVKNPIEAFLYGFNEKLGGGIIGGLFSFFFCRAFGVVGTYILTIIGVIVSIVLITEKSVIKGFQKGGQKMYASAKEGSERYQKYLKNRAEERKRLEEIWDLEDEEEEEDDD